MCACIFAQGWHKPAMVMKSTAFAALLALSSPAMADEPAPTPAEAQFAQILGWEGRWQVAETDALQIVFEVTARGKTVVERWETASGLHSITVYHLDADSVIATHYCPQGNQPRLQSVAGDGSVIAFEFRDITGLDEGESHQFALSYTVREDGSLLRSEVYRSAEGEGEPGSYTLMRAPESGS
ncbi:MAG: hypothetical protein CL955_08680 [Erythrobacteraceae bacterium]|nr:hypothetical protein [Erythrobacteraceae bacterium]